MNKVLCDKLIMVFLMLREAELMSCGFCMEDFKACYLYSNIGYISQRYMKYEDHAFSNSIGLLKLNT